MVIRWICMDVGRIRFKKPRAHCSRCSAYSRWRDVFHGWPIMNAEYLLLGLIVFLGLLVGADWLAYLFHWEQ
jgi:hypothetical protein